MKYLGIDYGAKRVGLAVSNTEGTIAFPRTTLGNGPDVLEDLACIIRKEGIEKIVMGDTRSYGGAENLVTKDAEAFADALAATAGIAVKKFFEVATSVEARAYVPEGHDDAAAAAVILQRYLDMKGGRVE
jgi:putative Holliday junction resolvase